MMKLFGLILIVIVPLIVFSVIVGACIKHAVDVYDIEETVVTDEESWVFVPDGNATATIDESNITTVNGTMEHPHHIERERSGRATFWLFATWIIVTILVCTYILYAYILLMVMIELRLDVAMCDYPGCWRNLVYREIHKDYAFVHGWFFTGDEAYCPKHADIIKRGRK